MSTPSSPVMPTWRSWRQRVAVSALVVLLTACGGGGGSSTSSGGVDPTLAAQINDIKPSDDTKVSVFVELAPTAATSAAQLDTDPATLRRQIQEQFLKDLQSAAASRPASAADSGSCHVDANDLKKRITDAYMPTSGAAVRIELNACELDVLPTLNNVTVKGVHADIPLDLHASADAHTLALEVQRSFDGTGATTGIANGQSTAWPVLSSGQRADGSGLVIAVLDTGVEERHPALGAKVLKGACFSSSTSNSSSLCPAGVSVDTTTAQAGRSCADSTAWTDRASAIRAGCAHGTSMASVAAMNYASKSGNPAHGGVAKGAGILPIQVFSKTGSASIGSSASDLLAAIEWLTQQADTYRRDGKTVVALNMSLGGGRYSSACDSDYVGGLFKTAFANLRAQGILPIAAAGNEGNRNAISFPACVSNALSVAAAKLNYSGIASYSNFSSQVKLFAPGGDVDGMYAMPTLCASNGSGNFDCWSQNAGTSPATAFVSGAVAALRSTAPTATLADIESALTRDLTNSYPDLAKTMTVGNVTRPALRVTASGKSLLGERSDTSTPSTYSIGGAVTGLGSGKTVTLSNSVTRETLSVSTNGSYAFATAVPANGTYQVVVSAQPSGQTCTVGNASGTVTAAVTNINVVCSDNTATGGKDNAAGNCVTNSNGAQVCNDTGSGSARTTIQYFVLCVFPQTNYQGYAACAPWDGSAHNVYGYYGPIRSLWVRSITYNTANYEFTLGAPITTTDQFKVTLRPMTSKAAAVVTRSNTDLQSQLPTNALVRQVILEKP